MDDIRGLKPFVFFAPNWKLALLVGLGVLGSMAVAAWLLRRKPAVVALLAGPAASAAPARSVRQQLDALRANRLIEKGRVKDFHGGLSAIIRGYLGARYQLPGQRLTTTELLAGLERQAIEPAIFQLIADFLPECDMVKFADARPTVNDMETRLATAYYLVERLGDAGVAEEADELAPEPAPSAAPAARPGGSLDVVG